jgi:hypothetical protein
VTNEIPGDVNDQEPNPFQPPKSEFHPPDPSTDPSVFDEPWMKDNQAVRMTDRPLDPNQLSKSDDPEKSVWDEPGIASALTGDLPADAVTWFGWYQANARQIPLLTSWQITVAAAIASGLFASLTVLMMQLHVQAQITVTIVLLPIFQELMKIVIPIWICEKRPWLFQSPIQIVFCGVVSALMVSTAANVFLISVVFKNAPTWIVLWRLVVCPALQVLCSLVASIGLVKVWRGIQARRGMPQLSDGAWWITAAMLIHGGYNAAALLWGEILIQL